MITEIYVPRTALAGFMAEAAADFRKNDVNVIYGTIRLIERDGKASAVGAAALRLCDLQPACGAYAGRPAARR
jgi:hypothetical protein